MSADDPNHPNNSARHHTGNLSIEGCGRPAGTAWSPFWCQPCNAERFRRVDAGLEACMKHLTAKEPTP